jgi:hypothetical protein
MGEVDAGLRNRAGPLRDRAVDDLRGEVAIQAAVLRRWAVGLSPRTRLKATERAKALA